MNAPLPPALAPSLEHAILETLAYFDVFEFPVRLEELHRYLHGVHASQPELESVLRSPTWAGRTESQDGYYVLAGRRPLIDSYESRAHQNARHLYLAMHYGRLLARLPFVRMVAVTGSVAMQNGGAGADYDYLLIAAPGRLWLSRAFSIAVGRWARLRGDTLCPNVILSERALVWRHQDLYIAHELTQMIPVSGLRLYQRFRELNRWTQAHLPNAQGAPRTERVDQTPLWTWQSVFEAPLRATFGNALEALEMKRKVARFGSQNGVGTETFFSADVCQGNFQHHGQHTRQAFERRLADLGLVPSVPDVASALPSDSPVLITDLSGSASQRGASSSGVRSTGASVVGND